MDYKILKPIDIIIENIIIKKKISIGSNIYNYPIKYLNNSLIIQTPILTMPFGKYSYGSKSYIDASFINDVVDKDMVNFKEIIVNINNLVINYITKTNNKLNFFNSIKNSNNIYSDRIRLNIQEDILVFNEKKHLVSHEYLKSKAYVKFLITPNNIWRNEEKFGISWTILQAKVYPQTILNTYCFLDSKEDEPNNSNKYNSHPTYKKYFKMISCGVPKEAVKHKMIIDNLDPDVLDNSVNKLQIEGINNTNSINSINNANITNSINNANNVNIINNKNDKFNNLNSSLGNIFASKLNAYPKLNILNEIKLSKLKKCEKKKNILKDVKCINSYNPPSLTQILDMKNKLNKINKFRIET